MVKDLMGMSLIIPQTYKMSLYLSNLFFTFFALVSISIFQTLCTSLSFSVTAVVFFLGFVCTAY